MSSMDDDLISRKVAMTMLECTGQINAVFVVRDMPAAQVEKTCGHVNRDAQGVCWDCGLDPRALTPPPVAASPTPDPVEYQYNFTINGVPVEVVKWDGGPAFPTGLTPGHYSQEGMSRRDWFAGQALAGDMANASEGSFSNASSDEHLRARAELLFRMADAMIAAGRSK